MKKNTFSFFYSYTLFAKIGILCSYLPPKPCLPLEKTLILSLSKIKLLEKEKHSNFLLLHEKCSKCRKKKNGEINAYTTSYHSYSVKRKVTGVSKTTWRTCSNLLLLAQLSKERRSLLDWIEEPPIPLINSIDHQLTFSSKQKTSSNKGV